MTDALKALILELVPTDGSAIDNQSLLAAIQKRMPKVTEEIYREACDGLLADGILGKGRGRSRSVRLIDGIDVAVLDDNASIESDDDQADTDDEAKDDEISGEEGEIFTLTHTVESITTRRRSAAATKAKRRAKSTDGAQVLSYRHLDKRRNNPEVGMVHPENDPTTQKTAWTYDPHIDPALQFSLGRTAIEQVIESAIADRSSERSLAETLDGLIEETLAAGSTEEAWA